jgi:hypothetical protein
MTKEAQTLDKKPITESKSDLEIWDIDDSSLVDSLLDKSVSDGEDDPVLGSLNLDTESKTETKVEDKDEDESELDLKLEDDEVEVFEDFDPDKVGDESKEDAEDSEDEEEEEEKPKDKKVEVDNEETEENEFSVFANLLKENELLDFNEEEFEPTLDGIVDAFSTTVESRVKEEIELFQRNLPEEGKDLLRHIIKGGKVSEFSNVYSMPDVSALDIKGEKNINNQRAVLKEFLRLRGDSAEEAQETLQDYEDLGKLERQAERAQERLVQYNKSQKAQLEQKATQDAQVKEQKRAEVLKTIEETVTESKEIHGFPMSKKIKKDLMAYMTETSVKIDSPQGPQYVTKFQADELEAGNNVEDFILRAYLRMTNFDLKGVEKKTKTDYSSKLKATLQNSKQRTGAHAKFGGGKKTGQAEKSEAWDF